MQDPKDNQSGDQSPITHHPSPMGKLSTGPRTAEGKRRSCRNARKHGLYTDERFLESAARELGDDPRQFQRLLLGLIDDRRPVGTLETALVEDLALLLCKKAHLDRAELAVQVCNLRRHDLERRKQFIQVGHAASDAVEFEVREEGLRRHLDAPGKFEQVLKFLSGMLHMIEENEFGYRMQESLRALYGGEFTLRGAELDTLRFHLAKRKPQQEGFEAAKKDMTARVEEEIQAVWREYEVFLEEHVENTRAARMAATAPSHAQWAAIIRQQNSLHRQLERKIRLLLELQRERKSEEGLLERFAASMRSDPGGGGAGGVGRGGGGQGSPSKPMVADMPDGGTSAPPGVFHDLSGLPQSPSCGVTDVPAGQAEADLPPRLGKGGALAQYCSVK